jgi:hypothetical protein
VYVLSLPFFFFLCYIFELYFIAETVNKSFRVIPFFIAAFLVFQACKKKEEKASLRSIYDQSVFAQVCLQAAQDEAHFSDFKRNPFFNLLWENLSEEEGRMWLGKIQDQYPFALEKMEQFRQMDAIGAPRVYAFDAIGPISASTLRLSFIASDIQKKVGDLSQLRVVQIGAAYGGLCKILHTIADFRSFTLVDLPEQLQLAKKCLEVLGVKNVIYLSPEELAEGEVYDLAISDRSFSEFNCSYQKLFFDRILSSSRCGYLLGRIFPKHFGVKAMNAEELKMEFQKMGRFSTWEMREPSPENEDYFIFWKGVKE